RATRTDLLRWRGRLGIAARAPVVAAPIGTTLAAPDPGALPAQLDLNHPLFVALGTIEPRKNHAVLLDAWEELARRGGPVPQLVIAGRRGWKNHATFARLDALPPGGPVLELNGLSDGAVAALLEHSRALLMPSRAEGFGLPLTEAAGRGIPVLSTPLPAAGEILGDHALWLPHDDPRAWADAVAGLAAQPPRRLPPLAVPMWCDHLAAAFRAIGGIPAPLPAPGQEG
ncbi:MAG TPA: glycosyltransferase, partial [Paracoccus sp. (in: a-proteobacteria)]|nr:glycosyltransferase [Paracoccus sp. (in: a-proteobacteria)]